MSADAETAQRPRRWLAYLPLAVFAALAWLLFVRLYAGDPASIPSTLIGQSAPRLDLTGLDGATGLTDADLRAGHVSVVNIFASWCEPCHYEHEFLMALAADPSLKDKGVAIYGVAQKDSAENIRRFLGAKGDPYAKVGLDHRRTRRHRLGSLRRAGNLHRPGRRLAGVQARRPDDGGDARERNQAANHEGDELGRIAFGGSRHCEECNDEAIQRTLYDPWIASLRLTGVAMTGVRPDHERPKPLRRAGFMASSAARIPAP